MGAQLHGDETGYISFMFQQACLLCSIRISEARGGLNFNCGGLLRMLEPRVDNNLNFRGQKYFE
jgi:hypothetical protein